MAAKSLEARKVELEAEIAKVRKRIRPLVEQERALERELEKVECSVRAAEHLQRVRGLIGQEVRHSEVLNNHKFAWLNDITGRLVEVGRKYALVDFGEPRGKWRLPIRDVYAADDTNVGMTLFV